MGSHRRDGSKDDAEAQEKRRVEQTRIPAPPSGFARVDSLDDLDEHSSPGTGGQPSAAADDTVPVPVTEGAEPEFAFDPAPAEHPAPEPDPPKERRGPRWGRKKAEDTAEVPVSGEVPAVPEPAEPPKPTESSVPAVVDEEEAPLPETVPTEAVHTVGDDQPTDLLPVAEPEIPTLPDPATEAVATPTAKVRTGEPYEEHDEAMRSRRITDLEDQIADLRRLGRRGTTDLGLLLLRLAVGAYLAVDGCRKLFGWMGGPSLNGFETDLLNTPKPELGFSKSSAGIIAVGWSVTELVVGVVLIAGFITPIIAAFGLALASLDLAYGVTKAGGVHVFADQADQGGVAFQLALWIMLAVIILAGPGRYSIDGSRGWARRPGVGSLLLLISGIALAVLIWIAFNGANPLVSTGNRVG
ncbi:MAG: DoxX family membrane protein [Gordonia sp. (in: high G+C Gram-positive bacteria)]|uniref:DoxX family membrane protein n=1 Tax=Gordonia sp. (in: high G+C Gram-positive bacteria) TaxID=84139 RepID=UPI0039E30533